MTLAEKLRYHRRAAGLSAAEVARQVGVHKSTYSRWERGLVAPGFENRMLLATLYSVAPSHLRADKDEAA